MKRLIVFILTLGFVLQSCNPLPKISAPTREPTSKPTSTRNSTPESPSTKRRDTAERLKELGGVPCCGTPCTGNAVFTCVTITVPLDHFNPDNPETIDVVFAVAPATGERKGMYVQAFPGGPGGKGISRASKDYFSADIQSHYDLVFFDQRGLGLSNPLECKKAYADYFLAYLNETDTSGEQGYDSPADQQAAMQRARSFVDQCITEIGIDPAKLQFFTTNQVAEDIESFRQAMGDEKFMLYGSSYGTSVAQTYARSHPDHLAGLILDGTQDTTLAGEEVSVSQWEAINMVLLEVFKGCDARPECSSLLGGDAQAAYDKLAQKLSKAPISYEGSSSGGKKVEHSFTLNMLDYTATYQLYGLNSRMELMQALASANEGNLLPMADLFYRDASIDPSTGAYVGDPSFSDTMFYVVWCGDNPYYSGTSDERSKKLMQELQNRNGLIPRLDGLPIVELTCPYWPDAPSSPAHLEPLKAPGVPTLVLNATLDPATPFQEGKKVFESLENGFHIYVNGGTHTIYHSGFNCPSQYVNDFLVSGKLPDQREIVCDWGDPVFGH